MRFQLTAGDRKVLLIAAAVFVALLGFSLVMIRGKGTDEDIPSVYSTASGGCRGAFLLLRESGYRVDTWERPLRDLPPGNGVTLILAEPASSPVDNEKEKMATFLKGGGRLIATGRLAAFYLPVSNEEKMVPIPEQIWKPIPALTPSPITRAAPEITFAPHSYWGSTGKGLALYGDTSGPEVVQFKVGEGSVLWIADATPMTNAGLKEKGNLEFLLAAIGEPGPGRVLWDEYVHGYEQTREHGKSNPVIGWIILQLGLFSAAILLTYSRRNESVWMPPVERRLSPLEFVRTLGSLYEHANAGAVAVEIFYQRFRYLLTRRLGMSPNASINDLERVLHDRGVETNRNLRDTLAACESCRYDSQIAPSMALRLIQSLFDYAVRLKLIHSPKTERENNRWKLS